jgi:hypothetical protein
MKKFKRLFNVDSSGEPIIDADSKQMIGIADEVVQLLRKHNLCVGEAIQILRECESIINRKCEEMPF